MKSKVGQPSQTGTIVKNQCQKARKNMRLGGVHFEMILGGFLHDFGMLLRQVGGQTAYKNPVKKVTVFGHRPKGA